MNGRILCGNTVQPDDLPQRAPLGHELGAEWQRTQRTEYSKLTKDKREKGKDREQTADHRRQC
jgi:hypothetical protein